MEDTVAAAKAKEAEEAAKMAEAQKDISANATKGLPICDENNGHCAIPKEFGPNSKGAKQAEAAKKKAEEATRKAREDAEKAVEDAKDKIKGTIDGATEEALKNASKYHNASKADGRSSAQRHADEMAEHEREIAESEQEGRRQRQAEQQMAEEYEEQVRTRANPKQP